MKVFVTGGTGYVGLEIIKVLLQHNHEVVALVRAGSESKLGNLQNQIEICQGDVNQPQWITVTGCDAVIHLIAIIKEIPDKNITFEKLNFQSTKTMIDIAQRDGVKQFLYMSAAGSVPGLPDGYYHYKLDAESYLKQSNLAYTIFKPSLIYGKSIWGKNMGWVTFLNIPWTLSEQLPIIGETLQKWHPISKSEIAHDYLKALENDQYIDKTLIGQELFEMTYK